MTTVEQIATDAEARAQRNAMLREKLEATYQEIASDKAWFDGIFPHQWTGACYGAVARRWFLGDEPGAGKTRTSIAWLDLVGAKKVILVAEANVCAQFAGEISDLAPHRTIVNLAGLGKAARHERLNKLMRMDEGLVVINYEMFRRDEEALGKILLWRADSMIVDEAHNMKSTKTSNYKHVEKMVLANNTCPVCGELAYGLERPCGSCGWRNPYGAARGWNNEIANHAKEGVVKDATKMMFSTKSVKNFLPMTGTPILNTPVDLYSIFHLIDPVRFKSESWFKAQFTHMDYSLNRHVFRSKGMEKLSTLLKGRYLARTLSEVGIELPKQHIHVERVEIDPKQYPLQARTIEQVSKHAAIMLSTGETHNIMTMISVILRKRQAVTYPAGIEVKDQGGAVIFSVGKEVQESAKFDAAMERIKQYHKQGRRQVVFSQFQGALAALEKDIAQAGIRVARFDGTTPRALRDRIKMDFRDANNPNPEWDVVVVHYRTGGTGITLNGATVTHCLDEEWNAGKRDQAYARTRRIGQDSTTDVHIYRAAGPNAGVDMWMANLIRMKERMVTKLGEAMSAEKQMKLITDAIKNGDI